MHKVGIAISTNNVTIHIFIKNDEKIFKKYLTNEYLCGIIRA